MRISKYLARAGVASRRNADRLIEMGKVFINGKPAVLGQRIIPEKDEVRVNGKLVMQKEKKVYIMLHKPQGYLSTCSDPFGRPIVLDLLSSIPQRVFPVGRLDQDSEGMLILTNDGDLTYLLTHPKHQVIKEYIVETSGKKDQNKIVQLLSGVIIDGKRVDVDYAKFLKTLNTNLRILIGVHEGQKHLVKRLCNAVGYNVKRLVRTKTGSLTLSGLDKGKWRHLSKKEVEELYEAARLGLEGDYNVTK